ITVERELALIAIVGYKMKGGVGVTSGMMAALAEEGISVKMVIQGIREISLIIGIEEKDFEKALIRLYQFRTGVEDK
ncbi:MAG: ACT domain-containing protein, partial [Firmicutes bacterium]|nr:ACT domain-containing protein [Bacillota bacterium]